MSGPRYLKSQGVDEVVRDGVEQIMALPGVVEASATCCVPLEGGYGLPFTIVGRPAGAGAVPWRRRLADGRRPATSRSSRSRSSTAARSPIATRAHRTPVVIINEAMARQYWPKKSPLNDRLTIGRGGMREFADEPERQIIGVVSDVRDGGLNNDPEPTMYIPQAQVPDLGERAERAHHADGVGRPRRRQPYSLSGPIQEALRQATGLPVSDIRTMDQVVSPIDLAPAVQHVADDRVRPRGAGRWPRSASTA